jgi:3-dehydroquinate synthetase
MVDASLGGKTGFDLAEGKNLVGSFHAPRLVLADPDALSSLPKEEFRSGMAEVIKHGIISDPSLLTLCSHGLQSAIANPDAIVRLAMAVKIRLIEEDPYETGPRSTLNFGHTVGHAVELVSGFNLRHGEAVAIGMVAEAELAERLAVASKGVADAIREVLSALELPVHIPDGKRNPSVPMAFTDIVTASGPAASSGARDLTGGLAAKVEAALMETASQPARTFIAWSMAVSRSFER